MILPVTSAHTRLLKRTLRIGIAATLSTFCAQLLSLPNPWFATLAAIVAMQSTLQATYRSARNSVLGAVVGAGIGLAVAWLAKDQAWAVGVAVVVPLAVFGWIRFPAIGQQAALVSSVVVLVPEGPGFSTVDFARIRLEQAVIGIGVALLVMATVFPPRAHRKVRQQLAGVYRDMATLMDLATDALEGRPYPADAIAEARIDARSRMTQVDQLWDDAMSEHQAHSLLASHWKVTTRRIWEQCSVLATEVRDVQDAPILVECGGQLTTMTRLLHDALQRVSRWFHRVPADEVLELPDLEPAREAMLRRVREAEAADDAGSYATTLQALAVTNACNMIAERLVDLATQHADAVRIHGPAE
jgi:uncharacterized membrane protein YgaE (UPF0421/DUF939 family)